MGHDHFGTCFCSSPVAPVRYLSSCSTRFGRRVPLLADHGRSPPRGADDPPAAHLLCCQEVVQRHPQLHVSASCTPLDLRRKLPRISQVHSGGPRQLEDIKEEHHRSKPEVNNSSNGYN